MAAVPDLDLARIREFCEERTPPEYRDECASRPTCDAGRSRSSTAGRPGTAMASGLGSRRHRYDDLEPGPIGDLLEEITADPMYIFWG